MIYIGAAVGLAILVALAARADLAGVGHALRLGGLQLLWLVPYRAVFFSLYALGWGMLLYPLPAGSRVPLRYLLWVTTVREGVDRLLPVASVGGGVLGVRLLHWRGVPLSRGTATVLVEVVLTLLALWVFVLLGLTLMGINDHGELPAVDLALLLTLGLGVPIGLVVAFRAGQVFTRLGAALEFFTGHTALVSGAAHVDVELRALLQREPALLACATLQLCAFISGAFEVWFALSLFGHPVDARGALIIESLTQGARHLAFMIPGALGAQEAALVAVGAPLGISPEMSLAVSLVKRLREIVWGVPALLSWQWEEGRRITVTSRL